jgi:hypothetical protein
MSDGPKPSREHAPCALAVGCRNDVRRPLDPDPSKERGRDKKRSCTNRKDRAHVRDRDHDACQQRPDKRTETLDRRRRTVRRNQLRRSPCERRKQRLQGRPNQRRGESDDRAKSEDKDFTLRGIERCRRSSERSETGKGYPKEKALATETVAQRRRERCDKRSRQQAHEPRDPDRRRSAHLVSKDTERDEMRPLGRDRRTPRELDAPDVLITKGGADGRDHGTAADHAPIESHTPWSNKQLVVLDRAIAACPPRPRVPPRRGSGALLTIARGLLRGRAESAVGHAPQHRGGTVLGAIGPVGGPRCRKSG